MQHTHFSNRRKRQTHQITETTRVQPGEPKSFTGALTGAEMTHRQLCLPSPPQHGRLLTSAGNLERTAHPAGSSPGWRFSILVPQLAKPLVGSSAGFCFPPGYLDALCFSVALAAGLRGTPHSLYSLLLGGRCLVNLVSF